MYKRQAYKRCQTTVQAVLCHEGREYVLRVLFDTGNGLVSPYTGEKVAVLSADFASGLSLDRTPVSYTHLQKSSPIGRV